LANHAERSAASAISRRNPAQIGFKVFHSEDSWTRVRYSASAIIRLKGCEDSRPDDYLAENKSLAYTSRRPTSNRMLTVWPAMEIVDFPLNREILA
jgi:hypothetical protein